MGTAPTLGLEGKANQKVLESVPVRGAFMFLSAIRLRDLTGRGQYWLFFGKKSVTWQPAARSAVHLQRAAEEEWSLDASVELGSHFSLDFSISSPTKFQWRSLGIAGSGMELSIARFCCVLLSLLAGKFSVVKPLSYFDSIFFFFFY